MRGSRKFCQSGPTLTSFLFLAGEGREDPNSTKTVPSSARQRNAGGPMMAQFWTLNAGLVALQIFRGSGPYIFVIFRGVGGPDPLSPLWIRAWHRQDDIT